MEGETLQEKNDRQAQAIRELQDENQRLRERLADAEARVRELEKKDV